MILIDAIYINNSGGKVLLDYLIECLEKTKMEIHYLFDDRIKNNHPAIKTNQVTYLKASLFNRHKFYLKNHLRYNKVLCFGNLPPSFKLNVPVFTYLHQTLFLDIPKSISIVNKAKITLKIIVLNILKKNTNHWLVQSKFIGEGLSLKYKIDLECIKIIPFYPPLINVNVNYFRKKNGFVYISNGGVHKNHFNLIAGFCKFHDENKEGSLHITISEYFPILLKYIDERINSGYPIINHGFINREELIAIYNTNEYLIFPSLAESFGLGIIEAIENGCKVIGADLPYTYAVCNPSIIFNPLDSNDIKRALQDSQQESIKNTQQLAFNQIDDLILLLKS